MCGAPQWQYTDVCVGYPGSASPDALEHPQGRDGFRRSKAVPGQRLKDAIASPVDIPSTIARYQKTLQYASTPLDFVFGIGLYLAPSGMALHPGNVQGYNNEIVIAGSEAAIGHNPGINESEQIGKTAGDKSFEGKIAAPVGTDHKGPPSGKPAADPAGHADPVADPQGHQLLASGRATATSHEEEKTALIAAGVGLGLVALWLGSR